VDHGEIKQMPQRSRFRSIFFSILVVSLSLAFCFVVLEFLLGRILFANLDGNVDTQFDSDVGWMYVPGDYQIRADDSLIPHNIHINEYGLRGQVELAPDARGGSSRRILVLGDSFTFAKVVQDEEIYTSQLQSILNQDSETMHSVFNAGVEGFGTAQQLRLMERLVRSGVNGDLVILQVFTNDILDNLRIVYREKTESLARPGYVINAAGQLELDHLPEDPNKSRNRKGKKEGFYTIKVTRSIIESSIQSRPGLLKFLRSLGLNPKIPRMPGLLNGWYDEEIVASGVPLMRELIREIQSQAEQQQARLLVVLIPSPFMVYPDTYGPMLKGTFPDDPSVDMFLSDIARPQTYLARICTELNVPYLDLYPILTDNAAQALYFPREGHFTKVGHAVTAEALARKIQELGLE